jgi:hypothetical protein
MIIQRQLKYLYENTIIPHVVPELEEIQVNR